MVQQIRTRLVAAVVHNIGRLGLFGASAALTILTGIAVGPLATLAILAVPIPAAAQVSTSALVGATSGSFAVSRLGTATYHMPLTLPPGIAGMVPSLSLDYDSRGGDLLLTAT